MTVTFAVIFGFLLDAAFGDPKGGWHPACLIGRLISMLERALRRLFPKTPRGETAGGVVLWLLTCGISFSVPFFAFFLLRRHFWLSFALQTALCWLLFARKSLTRAGEQVRRALGASLEEGRKAVSLYVGRDTAELDEAGVTRAAVETVAENLTDGVVAPMVFLLIGGVPLGMLYKAVNTLDSMVGYHNEKYEYFGKCSAKMDDLWNFVPARIAAACMIAAAGLLRFDSKNALRVCRRDRLKHKSPNAGQTESACAGALHVQLGGDAKYFGKTVKKQAFGDPDKQIAPVDISRACDLMTMASVLALTLCCVARQLLTWPV